MSLRVRRLASEIEYGDGLTRLPISDKKEKL